jgi:hypothetical protein
MDLYTNLINFDWFNNRGLLDRFRPFSFKAMNGLRIFERFGFELPKEGEPEIKNNRVAQEYDEWFFEPKHFDWINTGNEQGLSDYKPSLGLIQLLNNNIDTLLD